MKVIHLRVSPYDEGDDYYICSKKRKPIEDGRWTWKKDETTCKNCIKNSSKCYIQKKRFKLLKTDDIKLARQCLDFKGLCCNNKDCLNEFCPLNKKWDLTTS